MLSLEDFVVERLRIYTMRRAQLYDGTSPLAHVRYTNTHRILDRQSQYMLRVLSQHAQQRPVYTMLCALLNSEHITKDLPIDVDKSSALRWLRARVKHGQALRGGAYILTSAMATESLVAHVLDALSSIETVLYSSTTVEQRYSALTSIRGIGRFLGYQLALTYSYLQPCTDYDTFIVPGEGALRGMYAHLGKKCSTHTAVEIMRDIQQNWQNKNIGRLVERTSDGRDIVLVLRGNDVQNVFCEFGKYVKLCANPRARHRFYVYNGAPLPAPYIPTHFA